MDEIPEIIKENAAKANDSSLPIKSRASYDREYQIFTFLIT